MNTATAWGIIFLVYVVPYFFWIASRDETLKIREKLYPGRDQEIKFDNNTTRYGLLWITGLVFIIFAWRLGWHPLGAVVVLVLAGLCIAAILWVIRQKAPRALFLLPVVRYWLAASGVWLLIVAAWYLVVERDTSLDGYQFVMLAIFPPVITAVALAAFRWAKNGLD